MKIVNKIFLIIIFILLFIPVYWMLIGSFQDIYGVSIMPPKMIPNNPNIDNYSYLLKDNVFVWLKNTIIVVVGTVFLSVFLSSSAGYAFSMYKFKGKKLIFILFLSQMMIPRISLLIPLYVIIKNLGISGKISAVILPVAFSPVGIYLAKNYFDTIPKSIIESARIDGASEWRILKSIIIPVSKPIISALALFSSITSLQDYIWQSLVLMKTERQTLLVGLMKISMLRGGEAILGVNPIGRSFATGILLLIPLLVVFLTANKYFVENLGGAVKE